MSAISPGVYTKITDISQYARTVPSTIGFIPIITEQGQDNELILTNAEDFYIDFGQPNINYVGKSYGQGPYICDQFLQESDSLYVIRCLPDDATYSNIFFSIQKTYPSTSLSDEEEDNIISSLSIHNEDSMNNQDEISGKIKDTDAFMCIRGIGRGEFYDNFQIRITKNVNPFYEDMYVLDIYQLQSNSLGDTDYEIVASYDVSFDPYKLDSSSESVFIEDILNKYFRYLKVQCDKEKCYEAVMANIDFSEPFLDGPIPLRGGTSGSLFTKNNRVDSDIASQILTLAYSGSLKKNYREEDSGAIQYVDEVLNTQDYYFTIVFDGGYPTEVKKSGIYPLVTTRKDCIALVDNGDNPTYSAALQARKSEHNFNTRYMAIYECYSKVYDKYTGKDIWVSPIYHMAKVIAYTDNVSQVWYAPAGFTKGSVSSILELRYSPRQEQRDNFYLSQLNPIVKFNVGYVFFGQQTTQSAPSALQDINIIRLVLYVKRALEEYCFNYILDDLNDNDVWTRINDEISAFLSDVQSKRGLYSYSTEVSATDYEKKRKECHANVTLEPTRVLEKINLNFTIK